ncbi:MAG: type II toxin-antitoxin system RelE/ParE family toxin [Planctomycetota bacterium]|nr:type II toxin-antitoxin system RelE/ParE family toxin [Planctomycetota bacterium]
MALPLNVQPEAWEDICNARIYYQENSNQAEISFLTEVTRIFDLIENEPEIGSPGPLGTRRKLLRGFPFFVVYEVTQEESLVWSVFNTHLEPDEWQQRVFESRESED